MCHLGHKLGYSHVDQFSPASSLNVNHLFPDSEAKIEFATLQVDLGHFPVLNMGQIERDWL